MTREIKFRALKNGKWWYSNDEAYFLREDKWVLCLYENDWFYKTIADGYDRHTKIGVAYQSTGLYDRYWIEIYEGDLLKYPRWKTYIVEYKQWMYPALYDYDVYEWDKSEVIGNIYKNPDLVPNKTPWTKTNI